MTCNWAHFVQRKQNSAPNCLSAKQWPCRYKSGSLAWKSRIQSDLKCFEGAPTGSKSEKSRRTNNTARRASIGDSIPQVLSTGFIVSGRGEVLCE